MHVNLPPENDLFFIHNIEAIDANYIADAGRENFFEIFWFRNDSQAELGDEKSTDLQGEQMFLIPPFRRYPIEITGKKGILIAFSNKILNLEIKEFSLDVYRLFSRHSAYVRLYIAPEVSAFLFVILDVLQKENAAKDKNILLLRTLLKAFLLKLISIKQQSITPTAINEKRIHQFLLLLEEHYTKERSVQFYADKLNLSAKRLNQILKQKLNKSISRIIQDRLVMEAKHELYTSKENIKEIAYKLGFNDKSYFSRFFKKMTGQTPEEYKKYLKEQVFNQTKRN